MTYEHKFRSEHIDDETIDELVRAGGYESRAEYLRALVREDAQRRDVTVGEPTDAEA